MEESRHPLTNQEKKGDPTRLLARRVTHGTVPMPSRWPWRHCPVLPAIRVRNRENGVAGCPALQRSSRTGLTWDRDPKIDELPRKEVIQPQLPLRLPCYDFVPITRPTLDRCLCCQLAHGLQVLPAFVT